MKPTWGGAVVLGFAIYAIAITPYSSQAIHLVTALFVSLLLVNAPLAAWSVRRIRVRREAPVRVREGDAFEVKLRVENPSPWTRTLVRLRDAGPLNGEGGELLLPVLGPRADETLHYRTRAVKRGRYRQQVCRIESSAPFGLFNARRTVDCVSEWLVHPRTYPMRGDLAESRTGITSPASPLTARPGQGMGFYGIREYRPGDPARKIHWASTRRLRKVVVKEFEDEVSQSALVVLDTDRRGAETPGGGENFEQAVRVAASLVRDAVRNGQSVRLAWHEENTARVHCDHYQGDETPALDALAGVATSTVPLADVLASLHEHLSRRVHVVVSAMQVTDEALAAMARLKASGWPISVMVIPPRSGDVEQERARIASRLQQAGIPGVVLDADLATTTTLPSLRGRT